MNFLIGFVLCVLSVRGRPDIEVRMKDMEDRANHRVHTVGSQGGRVLC